VIDYRALHLAGGAVHAVPQDLRNYVFGSTNPDNTTCDFRWDISKLPRKVDLRDAKVQNQGGYGSCVGQAISGAGEVLLGQRDRFVELSPLYLYHNSRKAVSDVLHTPITDTGTSVFMALGTATKLGVCQEILWPEGTSPLQEPSAPAYLDGASRLIDRYEQVGIDTLKISRDRLADVLVSVYCGMPVVFAIPLSNMFYGIRGPLAIHAIEYPRYMVTPNDPDFVGNHAMHIVGYDQDAEYLIVENSWDTGWGDQGYWAMPFRALYSCFELFAIREFAGERFEIPEYLRIRKNPIESNYGKAYRLYRAAFGRTPDSAGLAFWTGVLDNGTPLIEVAGGFINSAEFIDFYGAVPSNSNYALLLYLNVLHREPDPSGLAFWIEKLDQGISKAEVLVAVSESPENKLGATW
jgi:hypothetical protein